MSRGERRRRSSQARVHRWGARINDARFGAATAGLDRAGPDRGSIVLFVLFVCLAVAVVVQTLTVVILCADRSLKAEIDGRARVEEKDEALATLRLRVLSEWGAMPWTVIAQTAGVQGTLSEVPDSGGSALAASVRHTADASPVVVSAWLERGRDGPDLPLVGLVAGSVTWVSGRPSPWLQVDPAGEAGAGGVRPGTGPTGYLVTQPADPLLAEGVTLGSITASWRLDEGWRRLAADHAHTPGEPAGSVSAMAAVAGVTFLCGRPGESVPLPSGWGGAPGSVALLMVTGGADVDARDRGDLYGVIVVDEGNVALDGTVLHGALFAGDRVDLGSTGAVAFSEPILRRVTDRSLVRTRLVPGTRTETVE